MFDDEIVEMTRALEDLKKRNMECKARAVVNACRRECPIETHGLTETTIMLILSFSESYWLHSNISCKTLFNKGMGEVKNRVEICQIYLNSYYDLHRNYIENEGK